MSSFEIGRRRELVAEHDDEPEVGVVERIEAIVELASELREQPDLVETAVAGRRESLELRERALARRLRHESRRRTEERLGSLVHPEPELVLEPHRTQEPEGIVEEDRLRDRPDDARREVGAPVVRVVRLARADVDGDRVEGEVARREIGVDPLTDRREVDRLVDAVDDDPPGSVPLGERKHRPAEATREAIRCVARLGAGDVEVENRPLQELVADRASDDPCVFVPEDLAQTLIHRSRPAARGPSGCSGRSRSRIAIVPATRACSSIRIPSPRSVTGVPGAHGRVEHDRERVHRDRPHHPPPFTLHRTSVPVMSRRNPSAYPTGTMPIQVGRSATNLRP